MRTFRGIRERAAMLRSLTGDYYTARELRALVMFLLLGVGVLAVRGGKNIYYRYFTEQRGLAAMVALHQQDSMFTALTAAAAAKDTLQFSLPADSLLPASVYVSEHHHAKGEGLAAASISLNNGSIEELTQLPGVGEVTAKKIVAYRRERGRFRTLDELRNIPGLGGSRFEKMEPFLKLN